MLSLCANMSETGDVRAAQEATYERTCWVIRDYFGLAGTRPQLVG